jgi:hypothetical protein
MTLLDISVTSALSIAFLLVIDPEDTLDLITKFDAYLTLGWRYLKLAPPYLRMRFITYLTFRKMQKEFQLNTKHKL